ncbi:ubiquinol-cytochrome-c reductase complex subunit-domain-containing protein [Lanmaoa asiatica]|nr:ubiquinol-cytochrome-c reductase complex subunit-domain-containing protein [Lanmaoa asiatica]
MAHLTFQHTSPYTLGTTWLKRWTPTLGIWGAGVGTAALFVLSVTPVVKNGLLVKVPLLGSYYEDKIPASDKPF